MMIAFLALVSSGIFSIHIIDALHAWWLHRRDVMSDVRREILRLWMLVTRNAGAAAAFEFDKEFSRRR